jgi:hypothetical protein
VINNKEIEEIIVPRNDKISQFVLKSALLEPGENQVSFLLTGEDVSIKCRESGKVMDRVTLTNFRFSGLKVIMGKGPLDQAGGIKFVLLENEFLDIIMINSGVSILSRDIDIDLEEFPIFNFNGEFVKSTTTALGVFLGIDNTGDGSVDGYIRLENIKEENNLLGLAKSKWRVLARKGSKFKVKKIVLMFMPKDNSGSNAATDILRLKKFNFCNDKAVVIDNYFNIRSLKFQDIDTESKVSFINENTVEALVYFNRNRPMVSKDKVKLLLFSGEGKEAGQVKETRIYLPLNGKVLKNLPYLSFKYALINPQLQEINLSLSIKNKNKEEIIDLDEGFYERLGDSIEIKMSAVMSSIPNVKDLIIRFRLKKDVQWSSLGKDWYQFQVSEIRLYKKFPYPIFDKYLKEDFLNIICRKNPRLLKVNEVSLSLRDFENNKGFPDLKNMILSKKIELYSDKHKFKGEEGTTFRVEWAILEQLRAHDVEQQNNLPLITFKKINPTKYLVRIEGADKPFWIILSENFHTGWNIYQLSKPDYGAAEFDEIVADYPKLKIKEAKHLMDFSPSDTHFIVKKPLDAQHYIVNGYANGWYVDPLKLNSGKCFTLVIYFLPQSLFHICLAISILTFLGCLLYLFVVVINDKGKRAKK